MKKPMTWQQWVDLLRAVHTETRVCKVPHNRYCFYEAWFIVRQNAWWAEAQCLAFGDGDSAEYFRLRDFRMTDEHIDAIFKASIDWAIAEAAKEGVVVK